MFRSRTYWSISGASSNARYAYSSLVIHHCNILYFLILSYYMYIHTILLIIVHTYIPYLIIHTIAHHYYRSYIQYLILSFIHTVPHIIVHTYNCSLLYIHTVPHIIVHIIHIYIQFSRSTSFPSTYGLQRMAMLAQVLRLELNESIQYIFIYLSHVCRESHPAYCSGCSFSYSRSLFSNEMEVSRYVLLS